MSDFKVGDEVLISNVVDVVEHAPTVFNGKVGKIVKIIDDAGFCFHVEFNKKFGTNFSVWFFSSDQISHVNKYNQSNRHKLKKLIEETGYSSRRLSDIAVGNESYLYNQTGEARFNKKGDISNELFESLKETVKQAQIKLSNKLTDVLIDEREKLDLEPKTVDENNVPVIDKQTNITGENELKKVDSDPNDIARDLWNDENHVIATLNQVPPKNYGYALLCIAWVVTAFFGLVAFLCWLAVK